MAIASSSDAGQVSPRQLVETADFGNIVISPDGRRVAFRVEQPNIERNSIDSQWFVQDSDGLSRPIRVGDGGFAVQTFFGLSAPEPATWSPDGQWIYYRAVIDGRIDVWRAAADGSGAHAMTGDAADVREFILSPDGHILKYSVGPTRENISAAEQAQYANGVLVDKSVPIGHPLFKSGYLDGRQSTLRYRAGKELDRAPLLAEMNDEWKSIDLITGKRRNLAQHETIGGPSNSSSLPDSELGPSDLAVASTGDRTIVLTPSGDGKGLYSQPFYAISVIRGGGAKGRVRCQVDACNNKLITGARWRPGSDELVFTVSDPDRGRAQSLFRWNIESGAVRLVARSRGLLNGGRDERSACAISHDILVCAEAEADRPPRLERIDLETGRRDTLFDPNAALAADIARSTQVELLRWKDATGHTFTGQFFPARREAGKLPPLFVTYYDCLGFVRGGVGDEWPLASLAQQGISALCINRAPARLDAVERYDQGIAAVRSAIDLLASAGKIQRDKVGMGGLSFGTEVTLWTAVNSNLLAAVSIASPLPTPVGFELRRMYDDSFLPPLEKFWQLGSPMGTAVRWRRLSPVCNLDKLHAPVLMQMPEHEYLLSVDYAVPLIKARKAELYVFPDEAHFKFQPKHKLAVYERNLDWFRFWLQGVEDPDHAKKEQYRRWHDLRDAADHAASTSTAIPPPATNCPQSD
ncbi:Atxe2 family lasso peptide isopeptidase [Sphingomonas koreensis]|nr:Atxe2 family lasso peptide isopeptidase [Sphingomonas koreensis]